MTRLAIAALAALGLTVPLHAQTTNTQGLSREQRIAAHQQRVRNIQLAHRVVRMVRQEAGTEILPGGVPDVFEPESFDRELGKAFESAQVAPMLATELREINKQLFHAIVDDDTASTSPQGMQKIHDLLVKKDSTLTAEQWNALAEGYKQRVERFRLNPEARTTAPRVRQGSH